MFLPFSKKQWLILFSLWLAFMSSFVTRLSWSSIMPLALKDLHFTVSQGAFYISAFYFGYALTVLPGGMLADKWGYNKTIRLCLAGMILFTVPMFFVKTYTIGLIYRISLGLFSGPLHAACMSAIGDYFSTKQRGTAVGLYMTATSFGITAANALAPFVSAHYGWRAAFLAVSLIPLIVLIISFFIKATPSHKKHEVTNTITNQGIDAKEEAPQKLSLGETVRSVATNRNILLLAMTGFFATGTTWGVTSWANLYMVKQLEITTVAAGAVMTTYGIAALLTKPIAGYLGDVIPLKQNILAALFLWAFAPAIIAFAMNDSYQMLYVYGPLLGIGAFLYSPLTNTLGIQTAPPHLRGTTIGFINLFNQIGALSAPILLSRVIHYTHSYQDSLFVIALGPLLAGTFLLAMTKPKRKKQNT